MTHPQRVHTRKPKIIILHVRTDYVRNFSFEKRVNSYALRASSFVSDHPFTLNRCLRPIRKTIPPIYCCTDPNSDENFEKLHATAVVGGREDEKIHDQFSLHAGPYNATRSPPPRATMQIP
ncbi:unnamed protein product [Ectocarpus sp. 4 AP-2014]